MHLDIDAKPLRGNNLPARLKEVPDSCPICHKSIHPEYIGACCHDKRAIVQVVFRCVSHQCQEVFIATYRGLLEASNRASCSLINVAPKVSMPSKFSPTISTVSPSFIEIYNQAMTAESSGLTEIVGIGLRKQLEFLVKDYLIQQKASDAEAIKKTPLGQCIKKYIDDANVAACAERATWLGNDEAHYVRKWKDKDISDLKLLIKLTVNWMENVLLTKDYINDMDRTTT